MFRFNIIKNTIMDNNEIYAAIALALHEFEGNNVHDKEAGIITIRSKHTEWEMHSLNMTPRP